MKFEKSNSVGESSIHKSGLEAIFSSLVDRTVHFMSHALTKRTVGLSCAIFVFSTADLAGLPTQANAQEMMTYCERWGDYDPKCSEVAQNKNASPPTTRRSAGKSYVIMCNTTRQIIAMAALIDQSYEIGSNRVGDDRYLAAGWHTIDVNECNEGFSIANDQIAYFAFRSAEDLSPLQLMVKSYPNRARKEIPAICVDMDDRFQRTSNDIQDLTTRCTEGFHELETSFGILGGGNNIRIDLSEK